MHYIRDIVLERLVLEAVSDLSDFVRCYEPVFLYLLAKKNNAMRQKEYQQLQQAVEDGTKRIAEIDRLIERIEVHNSDKWIRCNPFTELHCILHKNILIWQRQRLCDLYGYRRYIFC